MSAGPARLRRHAASGRGRATRAGGARLDGHAACECGRATRAVALLASAVVLCGACAAPPAHESAQAPAASHVSLAAGVVAQVGSDAVLASTVAGIARAEDVTLEAARDRAVRDALLAAGARERFAGTGRVASAERGALARALLQQLKRDAQAEGPPTDAEVAHFTQEHWFDLDRPPMARTVHAVVVPASPGQDAPALALARRIADAVHGASDPAEFMKRARAVPAGTLKVVVQALDPCTADGRVEPDRPLPPGTPPPQFDDAFAKAANAIDKVGDQSSVVKSSSGYHVILLTEKLPEQRVPLDERRRRLSSEIMNNRARLALEKLVSRLTSSVPVEVVRSASDLTSRIRLAQ